MSDNQRQSAESVAVWKHLLVCNRFGHRWTDWFILNDVTQGRRCLRCNDVGMRPAHNDGSLHPAACGPGCRSQHTDDHSACPPSDGAPSPQSP